MSVIQGQTCDVCHSDAEFIQLGGHDGNKEFYYCQIHLPPLELKDSELEDAERV